VCYDYWDIRDAKYVAINFEHTSVLSLVYSVVCHQLGFGDTLRAYRHGSREGNTSLPIWLDNVQCTNVNRYLGEYAHRGWGNEDCQDAGIECSGIGLYIDK